MKLLNRPAVGIGLHRSGWPVALEHLAAVASNEGMLLDDFVEATFNHTRAKRPRREPWVGIFHHPVSVRSPRKRDFDDELRRLGNRRNWNRSRPSLCGAIALCGEVAREAEAWLGVPALALYIPTATDAPRWNADAALEKRRLLQAGTYLRNTQFIFQIAPAGWRRARLWYDAKWTNRQDDELRNIRIRPDVCRADVELISYLDNAAYDRIMAESVVVNEFFGAAANNLVAECMVRGTPLLANRLPAIEEYVGRDYPLFYNSLDDIPRLLEPARLRAASIHLLGEAQKLPSFAQFAQQVAAFTDAVPARRSQNWLFSRVTQWLPRKPQRPNGLATTP